MTSVIIQRVINETTSYEASEAVHRRKLCHDFRDRLKAVGLTVRGFAKLLGISEKTAYSWTSIIPPSSPALRILSLIELDRNMIGVLKELSGHD